MESPQQTQPQLTDDSLPKALTLDLSPGVQMKLKLIPTGRFIMGTAKPTRPEAPAVSAATTIGLAAALIAAILAKPAWLPYSGHKRPQISLRRFCLLILAMAVGIFGGVNRYEQQRIQQRYELALAGFEAANAIEKPAHEFVIAKPFYMGLHEVTQEQYEAVMGSNPSLCRGSEILLIRSVGVMRKPLLINCQAFPVDGSDSPVNRNGNMRVGRDRSRHITRVIQNPSEQR